MSANSRWDLNPGLKG